MYKDLGPEGAVPLLLAVYQVVTLSHTYRERAKHIPVSSSTLGERARSFHNKFFM